MSSVARYFHTIRYLKANQLFWRVRLRLLSSAVHEGALLNVRPSMRMLVRPVEGLTAMLGPTEFEFLGARRRVATPQDWEPPDAPKLWTYNLHYFDDLNAQEASARVDWHREVLERWVSENPPGRVNAWEPYPVSRRIVNWIKWTSRGNQLSFACRASLATQTRWLRRRLEFHLLGNHLLANAKALVFSGLYFDGQEADAWYEQGMQILQRELPEQVLSDGAHFELSPMYHAAVLEDLLDLVNILRCYDRDVPALWMDCAQRMLRWLQAMCHPDGGISFFNDAAFGIAASKIELDDYASRLGLMAPGNHNAAVVDLSASGYVRAKCGTAFLLCDCGSVGPDYLPGHAHADTLSFELSLNGKRVMVNSGTSRYGNDAERQRQRGTAAHNTVVVDGEDSSEVWGGFRVARRARTRLRWVRSFEPIEFVAEHDGYRRLPGQVGHERRWILDQKGMQIYDRLSGRFKIAEMYLHLHPDVEASRSDSNGVLLRQGGIGIATIVFEGALDVSLRDSTWHPRFGAPVHNSCIVVKFCRSQLLTRLSWADSA